MKFNPANHNTAKTIINSLKINTSVWITHHQTGELRQDVANIITIDTGSCHIHEDLSAEQAQELINMLNQHIEYIKEAELELLALQTKAAA